MKPALTQLIVVVVLTLGAVGGYVFWYNYVQSLDAEAASLAGDIAVKDADRVHSASARSAETDIAVQEAFVAEHLVATSDIVSFLERLEGTGKQFGAVVHVASVAGNEKSLDGHISLSLSVTGSFDAVMRTIGSIENAAYAASANDLSLSTADGSTWTATGIFTIATDIPKP